MTLSDVGIPGQLIDVLHGGDVDPSGRLLSVAEIQQSFRDLVRTRDTAGPRRATGTASDLLDDLMTPHTSPAPHMTGSNTSTAAGPGALHTSRESALHTSVKPAETIRGDDRLGREWTAVAAAHSGAGASCVALSIADALSDAARVSRLIEVAHPHRCGLVAASATELGLDPTGAWRRGARRHATLFRRATETSPGGWPEPAGGEPGETIVDLGLPAPANLARLVADQPRIVVVCRVSVPGLRLAEHLIGELGDLPVLLAAVGAGRWPGEANASLGPHLRDLRGAGRVVTVPHDRRLQVTGPTNAALPKSVASAGRALLDLIDTTRHHAGTLLGSTWAPPVPRQRGIIR